ncbi:MAG: PH domain-containing protein [Actinobacteria bacterium]|nr:PH domain-containing protein [Actinomycetota bacterium]
MAYPEHLLTDDETVLRQFRPHWRVFLPVVGWALLFGAVAGLVWWFDARGGDRSAVGPIAVVAALVLTVLVAVVPLVRWIGTLYVLTTERIVVRQGIVSKSGVEIPLENINNVLFSQSVVERLLGYGDVLIESAGSQGQSRLVDIPDPESFQSEVYRARELRSVHLEGGPAAADPVGQLERLGTLLERGLISQEEYDAKKRDLLDRI